MKKYIFLLLLFPIHSLAVDPPQAYLCGEWTSTGICDPVTGDNVDSYQSQLEDLGYSLVYSQIETVNSPTGKTMYKEFWFDTPDGSQHVEQCARSCPKVDDCPANMGRDVHGFCSPIPGGPFDCTNRPWVGPETNDGIPLCHPESGTLVPAYMDQWQGFFVQWEYAGMSTFATYQDNPHAIPPSSSMTQNIRVHFTSPDGGEMVKDCTQYCPSVSHCSDGYVPNLFGICTKTSCAPDEKFLDGYCVRDDLGNVDVIDAQSDTYNSQYNAAKGAALEALRLGNPDTEYGSFVYSRVHYEHFHSALVEKTSDADSHSALLSLVDDISADGYHILGYVHTDSGESTGDGADYAYATQLHNELGINLFYVYRSDGRLMPYVHSGPRVRKTRISATRTTARQRSAAIEQEESNPPRRRTTISATRSAR